MKKAPRAYTRKLTLRLQPSELQLLERWQQASTCTSLSEYVRQVVLRKPVVVTYRNASADAFLLEMLALKEELKAASDHYQRIGDRLSARCSEAELRTWLAGHDTARKQLDQSVQAIFLKLQQIHQLWLSK